MPATAIDTNARKIRFQTGNKSAFYQALRQRVNTHLAGRRAGRYADARLWVKGATYALIVVGAYAAIILGQLPGWAMLGCAMAYSMAIMLLAINLGHDATHDALSSRVWVNRVIQSAIFALLGANGYLWRMRHVKSHHTFPNVDGCDIDIDENPFLRLSPNHARRPWQRFQHFYAPLTYWIAALHTIVYQDFVYLRKKRLANMIGITHPAWAYALFIAGKVAYVTVTFLVPMAFIDLPWWQVLLGALVANGVSSILFVGLLIGTHFAEETVFPVVDDAHRLPSDWAVHALSTSVDWSPSSGLAAFIAGGVNAHAAHHLFPALSHVHYRDISRIIRDTAAEFGIRYNVTTLPRMLASHFRFLRAMSRAEPAG